MVVGRKSKSVGVMYIMVGLLFAVGLLAVGTQMDSSERTMALLFGFLILLIDIVIVAMYASTPSEAIILNPDKSISLPKDGVTIAMHEVTEISYRRASARGIQYKWGKVIISTVNNRYSVNYISECENVAKHLTNEWYAYRYAANAQNTPYGY